MLSLQQHQVLPGAEVGYQARRASCRASADGGVASVIGRVRLDHEAILYQPARAVNKLQATWTNLTNSLPNMWQTIDKNIKLVVS